MGVEFFERLWRAVALFCASNQSFGTDDATIHVASKYTRFITEGQDYADRLKAARPGQ